MLTTDAAAARAAAGAAVRGYAGLPNYRNTWLRLGFSEDEIEQRDPRFIDVLVVWGDDGAVRSRIRGHHDAGADHVCIQPLSPEGFGVLDGPRRKARTQRLRCGVRPFATATDGRDTSR